MRGDGRISIAAYGSADAELRVEKEITTLWPEAVVSILRIGRAADSAGRIVEDFEVTYRIDASVDVGDASAKAAPGVAFRSARAHFAGTPYNRMEFRLPGTRAS